MIKASHKAIGTVACLVGVVVLYSLLGGDSRTRSSEQSAAEIPLGMTNGTLVTPAVQGDRQAASFAAPVSLENFLEGFWGADWDDLRAHYAREGMLSDPDVPALPAWESVATRARAEAEAIYQRDQDFLAKVFVQRLEDDPDALKNALDVDDTTTLDPIVSQIKQEVAEIDYQLDLLLGRYLSELDRASVSVFGGQPDTSPLMDLRGEKQEGDFYRIHAEVEGWYATYRFNLDQHPGIAEIWRERAELLRERERRLRSFFSRFGGAPLAGR